MSNVRRVTESSTEAVIGSIFRFVAALLVALFISLSSGFAFITFSECGWLGSLGFDGACREMIGYAIGIAFLVFCISFGLLVWLAFIRNKSISPPSSKVPPSTLYWAWLALLALQYATPLWQIMAPDGAMFIAISSLLLIAAFIVASAVLAQYRARHPASALLALVPLVGPLIVGALLAKPMSSAGRGDA